jgi:Zn-dependent oligopeptidase
MVGVSDGVDGPGWPEELRDYRAIDPVTLTSALERALADAEARLESAIAASDRPGATFGEVVGTIDRALGELWNTTHGPCEAMRHVHPDEAVRSAAQAADARASAWRRALPLRDDLASAVTRYAATAEAERLEGEERRVLDHWLRLVRRTGFGLPDDARAELRAITARIVELETSFSQHLAEWSDGIDVTRDDLVGMPEPYVAGLGPGSGPGTLRISLDYPDLMPFLEASPRRDLREVLIRKRLGRAVEANRPLLEEALALRRRQATVLGYPSWAHYRIEPTMAGSPERVEAFHAELFAGLTALATDERRAMADRLEADTGDRLVQEWDVRYYDRRIVADEHAVDDEAVSDHLALDAVLDGMLELTGRVFGLRYAEAPETRAWHPEVRLLEVRDRTSGSRLGWCYLDLHPRPGKYGHAAADQLRIPLPDGSGARTPGVAMIMMNVPRSTPGLPARISHDDAVTLFHEFGHVLHEVLGTARFAATGMYEVQNDFVEAVSQIMENWAWAPAILERVSAHYRTGAPMPRQLAERVAAARFVNLGTRFLHWFGGYGAFDLRVHGPEPVDLDEAMREADAIQLRPTVEGAFWPAGFDHIMGGYDAGYYGYLWSLVIGDDLWSRFEAEGIDDPGVGAAFRREILEPCATRDADALVESFLGRPSTNEAFLRRTGIS